MIVLLALSLVVGTEPKPIVFLTNYVFRGRHAPFFVGVEKGFYREAGFDVAISPSTGSGFVIAALEGGKADFPRKRRGRDPGSRVVSHATTALSVRSRPRRMPRERSIGSRFLKERRTVSRRAS